ncbi:MAG: mannose-1-phosphate guanylyltransferase [Candidatus Lindowbacteria bacterium]|nr:mannose-1-phosphate guanylyltransferase [Candidatus Lindowbacteria bacterium]
MSKLVTTLLIGGKGERFWPRSRKGRPKQFLPVTSEEPMLIETLRRMDGLSDRSIAVVGADLADEAGIILKEYNRSDDVKLVAEITGRNTAPAIGLAAIECEDDDILVILPSDHFVPDADDFQKVIRTAANIAAVKSGIVCIGMKPTRPETGYGYIRPGDEIEGGFCIASFAEKPPVQRAQRLMEEGALWNGGIFVVRAGVYMELVQSHLPDLYDVLVKIKETGDASLFEEAPKISVDYGILEKCKESFVVQGNFHWDDVGDWGSMARVYDQDSEGNAVRGDFINIDSKNVIVDTDHGVVAVVGVEDIAIVRHKDAILIVKRGEEQKVRDVLVQLKQKDLEKYC